MTLNTTAYSGARQAQVLYISHSSHDLYPDCMNMTSLVCGGTDGYEIVSGDFIYSPVVADSGDDLVVSVFVSGNE